ncbi:hypothetical protein FV232_00825 [Methylobacterium sp. WL30]|uniref:hypothetical protein n=1 Tax=unclassified Methylobacterium TaxID=2615210 RepID=UPI0011C7E23E|nr:MULTISPECIES: hypothetical protein [unclassified Methylobacterium]TXN40504.1 hypothetical protein FV225_06030 [Methylobacterium sp. WL93]TXN52287.1 hypothetical protein FV227_04345 [Methylobacterium sp. WL119]TXN70630.1 hypothetical protein FV232_00825 [Methylobacterium sp. WL30]
MPRWLAVPATLLAAIIISAMVGALSNRWEAVNFSKDSMGWDTFYLLDRLTGSMQRCAIPTGPNGEGSIHAVCTKVL